MRVMNLKDIEEEAVTVTPILTISVERAAELLSIGRSLAYRMANDGRLPVIRCGTRLLVSVAELEAQISQASKGTIGGRPDQQPSA